MTRYKSTTIEYDCWLGMVQRCTNEKHPAWDRYGGRGITVCSRWLVFENFVADMGPRPSLKHSVDRFPNNDGNYEFGNCRWATATQQSRNKRNSRFIRFQGKRKTVAEWAEIKGLSLSLVHGRLRNGWTIHQSLMTPPGRRGQYDRSRRRQMRKAS